MSTYTCDGCGSPNVTSQILTEEFNYRGELYIIDFHAMVCQDCGEDYTTQEQSKLLANKLVLEYKNANNLLPGCILLEIRNYLKLSQPVMENMLGIGKNTIIRYEKDIIPQSKPVDILYRFLARAHEYPVLAKELYPDLDLSKSLKMEEMFTPIELEYENTPGYYISGITSHSSKEAA